MSSKRVNEGGVGPWQRTGAFEGTTALQVGWAELTSLPTSPPPAGPQPAAPPASVDDAAASGVS